MNKAIAVAAALMVVAAAGVPSLAAAGTGATPAASVDGDVVGAQSAPSNNTTSENNSLSPGAQLAGVIGVQGAELQGEVEHRTFGQTMAAAKSNSSKAKVIANQTQTLDERLADLRERQQELQAERENGTISEGQYKARMARLSAQIRSVSRIANSTDEQVQSLPEETLRENGVNVTAIQTLKQNASDLNGSEVSEIARTIGGGPPENVTRGPPDNRTTGQGDGPGNGHGPPTDVITGPNGNQGNANASAGNGQVNVSAGNGQSNVSVGNGNGQANVSAGNGQVNVSVGNGNGQANVSVGFNGDQGNGTQGDGNNSGNASNPNNGTGHGPDDNPGNGQDNDTGPLPLNTVLAGAYTFSGYDR